MRYGVKTSAACVFVLLALPALLFCGCAKKTDCVDRTGFAMGSLLTARVYGDNDTAGAAASALLAAAAQTDRQLSATDPAAEIYRLNEAGTLRTDAQTAALLRQSLALCEALDGKLDITLGAATSLWGFSGETPRVPAQAELAEALAARGLSRVKINETEITLAPGQKLDLGALGKGAGCDAAKAALDGFGTPAVVSLGGTVLLYGQKPGGAWSVGIRDPHGAQDASFATLTPETGAADGAIFISTSGSYEKTFTENGKTYHHILDPVTGMPVQTDLIAVTAVSQSGIVSDALSTALFVNGLNETSLGWVRTYLTGAVFVFADGRVYVTEGLRDVFTLTDTAAYRVIESYAEPDAH